MQGEVAVGVTAPRAQNSVEPEADQRNEPNDVERINGLEAGDARVQRPPIRIRAVAHEPLNGPSVAEAAARTEGEVHSVAGKLSLVEQPRVPDAQSEGRLIFVRARQGGRSHEKHQTPQQADGRAHSGRSSTPLANRARLR